MKTLFLPFSTSPGRKICLGFAGVCVALHGFVMAADTQKPGDAETEEPDAVLERYGKRNVRVHDPSSIVQCRERDEYWMFSTGRGVRSWRSADLQNWEPGPRVFDEIPGWVASVAENQRGHFWAPDIIEIKNRYLLYYSVSRFGVNTSAIALASNTTLNPDNPKYEWQDLGIVIQSRVDDNFNAIDPAVIQTDNEELWMSFGSFWSGIKLVQLDPATGKRLKTESPLYSLADYEAIEAPHIYQHGEYYYLFVNWDRCCRGINSTYNIRVGRSRTITGPYLDKEGVNMMDEGGTLVLDTNGPFIGPGHANVRKHNGRYLFSCHFYDATQEGRPMLAILPLRWTEDQWPVVRPASFATNPQD